MQNVDDILYSRVVGWVEGVEAVAPRAAEEMAEEEEARGHAAGSAIGAVAQAQAT
jgi:hypothetical protein